MESTLDLIFTPENSSNIGLGIQIRQQIESLANMFIGLDDQEKTIKINKKSLVLEMADSFERLHSIGEYPFPINNICNSIYRYLYRKGFDISDRYIQKILKENAPQYLNYSYQRANSSAIDIKLSQEETLEALRILKDTNLDALRVEQIQDLIPSLYEIIDDCEDYAQRNNITPAPSGRGKETTTPQYDSEDNDPYKEHIPCDKPDQRTTPSNLVDATFRLGESILKCGNTIINIAKMMKEYPPNAEDLEMEVNAVKRVNEWRSFWDVLALALKNGTDRKYRRSVIQWTQIADDEKDWGKHAASSKNPYIARFKDKDGNWKEEVRKLTREQIGDVAPKAREFALLFKKVLPACLDFIHCSEIYLFPYAAGLSTKLHDKLQDRSMR